MFYKARVEILQYSQLPKKIIISSRFEQVFEDYEWTFSTAGRWNGNLNLRHKKK